MKNIKNIIGYNFKTLISFELLYKLLTTIIFVPLFLTLFKLITKVTGYNYLTLENVFSFLTNPLTIIFLLILIMVLTFYTLIDISTIIIINDASATKKKISVKEAFSLALSKSLKVFKLKNISIVFLIIFLIPFVNLGLTSSLISTIKIPEFIMDFIVKNNVLVIVYIIFSIILMITLFRWLYALHYFVLEDCSFKVARKKSAKLSKNNKIKDLLRILVIELGIVFIYVIFILLGIFIIILLSKLFSKTNIFGNLTITIIWLLIAISFIVMILLANPISYAIISILYYKHKETNKEKVKHIVVKNEIIKKSKYKGLIYVVIVMVIISASLFTYLLGNNKLNFNIEYLKNMEVTAHRGASVMYPENTMAAFQGAKELNANWIELDVQQTKDQQIVVMHDTNLKRTTGINKNTLDLDYAEIATLDAGSFFDPKFKDERIPLLEDVIKYALENNIKLNIELKPTGKEIDFEKKVVDLINKYNFKDNAVVTSQVYEVLENVKKYDKEIKTVYVMSLAYGDILSLKDADSFSIEASSITKTLVKNIHNAGKEVYAWTVNTKESITKMVELNVDNIITDNISLAIDTIYENKTSDVVKEYIKFVNDLLK